MEKRSQSILEVDREAVFFPIGHNLSIKFTCGWELEHQHKLWLSSVIKVPKSCFAHPIQDSCKCDYYSDLLGYCLKLESSAVNVSNANVSIIIIIIASHRW